MAKHECTIQIHLLNEHEYFIPYKDNLLKFKSCVNVLNFPAVYEH
jgi:hypothetical protein